MVQVDILAVGGALVDVLAHAREVSLVDDSTPGTMTRGHGGVARNVCEAAARLGGLVSLRTVVGTDSEGESLLQRLRSLRVRTELVLRTASCPTSHYIAVHARDGTLITAVSACDALQLLQPPPLTALASARVLLLDSNTPPAVQSAVCAALRTLGDTRGARRPIFALEPVSVAKSKWVPDEVIAQLDICKPNAAEVRAMARMDQGVPLRHALRAVVLTGGAQCVVCTCGPGGVVVGLRHPPGGPLARALSCPPAAWAAAGAVDVSHQRLELLDGADSPVATAGVGSSEALQDGSDGVRCVMYLLPPPSITPKELLSVTGAGDCYFAAVLLWLARGADLPAALLAGTAAAASALRSPVAIPADLAAHVPAPPRAAHL